MADPRASIDFEGIDGHYTTFAIDGSTITFDVTQPRGAAATMIDKAVSMSAAKTVQLAADGDHVIGRLERVESDGFCAVQDGGYTVLPGGTAAALTPGTRFVGALLGGARGYIRNAASGTAAEMNGPGNLIVDATDTTAVKVRVS
jgi:hypothetical protein